MRTARGLTVSRLVSGRYHLRCICSDFLQWAFQPDPQRPESGCAIEQAIRDRRTQKRFTQKLGRRERQELERRLSERGDVGLVEARVKDAMLRRLQQLELAYPIEIEHFSIMDNHLHLVVRIDPRDAAAWSALEVSQRWLTLHPGQKLKKDPEGLELEIVAKAEDESWVAERRERLSDLSWFVKDFAQIIAQDFNRATGNRGGLWAGRFRCDRVKDNLNAMAAVALYVELNPLRAGLCRVPEAGMFTSLEARIAHRGQSAPVGITEGCCTRAQREAAAASRASRCELSRRWLKPFAAEDPEAGYVARMVELQDRHRKSEITQPEYERAKSDAASTWQRARNGGILSWITWKQWLQLVDAAARELRSGKASMAKGAAGIMDRLGELIESAMGWPSDGDEHAEVGG